VQQQKQVEGTEQYELTASNASRASKLVKEGKASLEVLVYPWGVELALASPCCQIDGLEGGEGLEV
jgi:hypothetical protein